MRSQRERRLSISSCLVSFQRFLESDEVVIILSLEARGARKRMLPSSLQPPQPATPNTRAHTSTRRRALVGKFTTSRNIYIQIARAREHESLNHLFRFSSKAGARLERNILERRNIEKCLRQFNV